MLGRIPQSKDIGAATHVGVLPFEEQEAFRTLRASLRYFNSNRELKSVVVTSALNGDGKSTVAWYLAAAAAANSQVVLVETDLREPSLAAVHGLAPSPGLCEVLTNQLDIGEAIQGVRVPSGSGPTGNGNLSPAESWLSVIVAGTRPPNPTELIESHTMADTLERLVDAYDFVVLDTPPTSIVSDAFPLMTRVSGVIVVSRPGVITRDSAVALRERLERLNAPILGMVANRVKKHRRTYGYGSNYLPRAGEETVGARVSGPQNG
jgi:capsular exopolysaccharide synthesis family protein